MDTTLLRHPWVRFLIPWLAVLLLVIWLITQKNLTHSAGSSPIGRIIQVQGEVYLRRFGELAWSKARAGLEITENDYISTGKGAEAQLDFFTNHIVTVGAESVLKLGKSRGRLSELELVLLRGQAGGQSKKAKLNEASTVKTQDKISQDPNDTAAFEPRTRELVLRTHQGQFALNDWEELLLEAPEDPESAPQILSSQPQQTEIIAASKETATDLETSETSAPSLSAQSLPSLNHLGGRYVSLWPQRVQDSPLPLQIHGVEGLKRLGYSLFVRLYAAQSSRIWNDEAIDQSGRFLMSPMEIPGFQVSSQSQIETALQVGVIYPHGDHKLLKPLVGDELTFINFRVYQPSEQLTLQLDKLHYEATATTDSAWIKIDAPVQASVRLSLSKRVDRQVIYGFIAGAQNRVSIEPWIYLPQHAYFIISQGQVVGFIEPKTLSSEELASIVKALNPDLIYDGTARAFLGPMPSVDLATLKDQNSELYHLNGATFYKINPGLLNSRPSRELLQKSGGFAFQEEVEVLYLRSR